MVKPAGTVRAAVAQRGEAGGTPRRDLLAIGLLHGIVSFELLDLRDQHPVADSAHGAPQFAVADGPFAAM
ncbi:hypothetical protein [Ancylobacter amanitiformis]|uniref:Uncharacterized protein n=1 Tax=Ancylobacter amanitiformis TaxID=217069 RepID=A0ABU0LT42_9HYPH|nr:hypothetical protein [Ancylobacter amanitiformis]MDQ0511882.1 hypothetical protein [Ancylobacter amanitiformis]